MKFVKTTATKHEKGYYQHFGIRPIIASMYGCKPEDIVDVKFKISDDQTTPASNDNSLNADYWGWFDNKKKEFTLIYQKYFLLEMCFAYGIKASEDQGNGKAYRLELITL